MICHFWQSDKLRQHLQQTLDQLAHLARRTLRNTVTAPLL